MAKKKGEIRSSSWIDFSRTNVEQKGGHVEGFGPKFGRHGGLDEKSTNNVI